MISRIIVTIILLLSAPSIVGAQDRGRGQRGQRGTTQRAVPQRGQRPPDTYYGGGIYGPGRIQDQRWRGVPGGRFWRGQYYAPGVGPCWALLPIVGWTWTCGP